MSRPSLGSALILALACLVLAAPSSLRAAFLFEEGFQILDSVIVVQGLQELRAHDGQDPSAPSFELLFRDLTDRAAVEDVSVPPDPHGGFHGFPRHRLQGVVSKLNLADGRVLWRFLVTAIDDRPTPSLLALQKTGASGDADLESLREVARRVVREKDDTVVANALFLLERRGVLDEVLKALVARMRP